MPDRRAEADSLLHRAYTAHSANEFEEAARGYRRALALCPELLAASHLLAILWLQQGDASRASAKLRSLLRRGSREPAIALALGQACDAAGDSAGAATSFRWNVALHPPENAGWVGLGNDAARSGDFGLAASRLKRAIAIDSDDAVTLGNLGSALAELGETSAARWQRRSLARAPAMRSGWINIGHHVRGVGDWAAAARAYARAMATSPADATLLSEAVHAFLHIAHWKDLDLLVARLKKLVADGDAAPPFHLLALDLAAPLKRANAARWCGRFAGAPRPRQKSAERGDRVRLGYLSGDFRRHVVAYHMADLIECHDPDRVALSAYTWAADDGSEVRSRLAAACGGLTDARRLDDAAAAARIEADRVDVLIDLAGHTHGARPGIVARRPAPIQVSYFGFPGTSGAPYHDYVLVDPIVAPPGADAEFTEAVVRLPVCYFPFDAREPPATPVRRALGLPDDAVVLACFNQIYKIQPRTFSIWMQVLAAVPKAVVWLLDPGQAARDNLRGAAAAASIDPSRLVFAPPMARAQHLNRCAAADLAIDTLPYNAHSTAMDILAAGCPMVGMLGRDYAGRVSASMLTEVGLGDLIAPDEGRALALMIELAGDRGKLAAVRGRLGERLRLGPLFDMRRLCRSIEDAIVEMHRRRLAGEPVCALDFSG